MGYRLNVQESIPGRGKRSFPSPQSPDQHYGPYSFLYNGYQGVLSPEVKWKEHKADHSPLSGAEVICIYGVVLN
jgi:hypothetical protein